MAAARRLRSAGFFDCFAMVKSLRQAKALHVGHGFGRPHSGAVAFEQAKGDQLHHRPRQRAGGADLTGREVAAELLCQCIYAAPTSSS